MVLFMNSMTYNTFHSCDKFIDIAPSNVVFLKHNTNWTVFFRNSCQNKRWKQGSFFFTMMTLISKYSKEINYLLNISCVKA